MKYSTKFFSSLVKHNQISYVTTNLNDIRKAKAGVNWKVIAKDIRTPEMLALLDEFVSVNDYIKHHAVSDEFLTARIGTLDWKVVSQYCTAMGEAFITTNAVKLDWKILLKYKLDFGVPFLETMYEYYDNDILLMNQNLSEAFITAHWAEIDKDLVSRYQNLSQSFVADNSADLNFSELLVGNNLTELMITTTYPGNVPLNSALRYVEISEDALDEANCYLNWNLVSRYQTHVSTPFLEMYKDFLSWELLSEHRRFSEAEMVQFSDYLNWTMLSKVNTAQMGEAFIVTHKDKLSGKLISKYKAGLTESFMSQNITYLNLDYLIMYQTLTITILESVVLNSVQWEAIGKFQTLTEAFMHTYLSSLNTSYLAKFQTLSESFITNHITLLPSDLVSYYQTLSEGWIVTNTDWVNWSAIAMQQTLSGGFKTTHADKLNEDLFT